ncbi:FecR family protein [Niabella hirudinis]|uniref:FecR family protein n=1 Tax=Niabella hirudinis TaxID=1285929 RepID=UPI003EBF2BB2
MSGKRLKYLFKKFLAGDCSSAEEQELFNLVLEPAREKEVRALLDEAWGEMPEASGLPPEARGAIMDRILHPPAANPFPEQKLKRIDFKKWMIAACLLLLAGVAVYLLADRKPYSGQHETARQTDVTADIKAPLLSKAALILEDGTVVALDQAAAGTLVDRNGVLVNRNADGSIVYSGNGNGSHKLVNPRGSPVVQVTLQDGTKIWLNSGSSVQYPEAFGNGERAVGLTGEAYFEVAKQNGKKFTVSAAGTTTEVLGTHFVVNAFKDMGTVAVTLLEGSVNVMNKHSALKIKPGQQARMEEFSPIALQQRANADEAIAWKNGLFYFENANIKQVMNQVARWYDVDVVYKGRESRKHFSGIVSRMENVSQVLRLLKLAGMQFKIEDRNITVFQ